MEQGTAEWLQYRCGRVTASRVADIIAKTKTGYSASRANYAAELVAERLTGTPADRFTNAAMQWGTDNEAGARDAYAFLTDSDVVQIGFVDHPTLPMCGASPDGLVGEFGLVEIKCPNTATHIDTLLRGEVDGRYLTQMQWQMAVTGRAWCDFVSFDPRLPPSMQLFIKRVVRDEARIAELSEEVCKFLAEVDSTVARLRERYDRSAA